MDMKQLIQQVTDKVIERLAQTKPTYYLIGHHLNHIESYLLQQGIKPVKRPPYSEELRYKRVIIAEVGSMKSLIRIANLIVTNPLEDLIVQELLDGQPIFIKLTAEMPINRKLTAKIRASQGELKQMGVIFIEGEDPDDYFSTLIKNSISPSPLIDDKAVENKKQLISLKVLQENYLLDELTSFELEPNTILTALAQDYLREKHIQVVRK